MYNNISYNVQKFAITFLKEISSAHQGCI